MNITVLRTDPDGTMLGVDEDGTLYTGAVVHIPHSEMTVETTVADDGLSYHRTTSWKGQVVGQGGCDEAGFNEHNRLIGRTDEERAALWEAEKAITGHTDSTLVELVDWVAK